jgi:hypothetical protein
MGKTPWGRKGFFHSFWPAQIRPLAALKHSKRRWKAINCTKLLCNSSRRQLAHNTGKRLLNRPRYVRLCGRPQPAFDQGLHSVNLVSGMPVEPDRYRPTSYINTRLTGFRRQYLESTSLRSSRGKYRSIRSAPSNIMEFQACSRDVSINDSLPTMTIPLHAPATPVLHMTTSISAPPSRSHSLPSYDRQSSRGTGGTNSDFSHTFPGAQYNSPSTGSSNASQNPKQTNSAKETTGPNPRVDWR